MKRVRMIAIAATALSVALLGTGAQAYDEMQVSDGGTISGKVSFNGSVPTRKIIPTKDSDVCGGIRDEALVMVGPDKGVQDAVVYLKGIEKGKAWGEPAGLPELKNVKCQFDPHIQVIRTGDLDVVNSDPVLHNTHGFYGKRTAFNLALPNKDQRITTELARPGIVRVECDAHGWMLGWIYVTDSPYYALTAEDGTFSITDVPPGTYTLVTWQEYTGPKETGVTVEAGKATEIAIEIKK
jgi:Carboxypeptidase regulatory-like domain